MKTIQTTTLALSALLMIGVLSGCGGGGGTMGRELRMNVTTSESSVWQTAANTFKELVEERTEGRYQIVIYPDEQLSNGDESWGVQNILNGDTDLDIHAVSVLEQYEERLAVLSLPWLFSGGYESVDQTLFSGGGRDAVLRLIRNIGVEPLALGENGFRQLTNNVRSIASPADMRGLKFRVPENEVYASVIRALGGVPTALNWSETLPALASDQLDGQENTLDTIRSGQVHQVQKYLTVWNCVYDPICLSVSSALWTELGEEDRAIFRTAAEEACAAEIAASRTETENLLEEFAVSGVEVTEPGEIQLQQFRDLTASVYDEWRDRIGAELLDAFGYSSQP